MHYLEAAAGVTLTGDTCTRVLFLVHCTCINLCCSNFPLLLEGAAAGAFLCTRKSTFFQYGYSV